MKFIKESSEKLSMKNQEWKQREKELQQREAAKSAFEEQSRGERERESFLSFMNNIPLLPLSCFIQNKKGSEIDQVIMTISWDEFEVVETLGTGSFATVYKAMWRGDLVAVKRIKDSDASTAEEKKELLDNFRRETFILRYRFSKIDSVLAFI